VNIFRHIPGQRALALLVCAGMFIIGQCCALGLMPPSPAAAKAGDSLHACCKTPASQQAPEKGGDTQWCCHKQLKEAPRATLKAPATDTAPLIAFLPFLAILQPTLSQTQPSGPDVDTGPPGSFGFSEWILKGSLLSHAPPARA
jgi:hypothetical protein